MTNPASELRALSSEKRIKDLADQAVSTSDEQESNRLLTELRAAIHEYTAHVRAMMRASFPKRGIEPVPESKNRGRRKTDRQPEPIEKHRTEYAPERRKKA
jgi:hypothetical protein